MINHRIHPRYKRPIAERLALGAYQLAYGITSRGRFQGPFPTAINVAEGSTLVIEYDNGQSELDIRTTNGFEVHTFIIGLSYFINVYQLLNIITINGIAMETFASQSAW